MERVSKRFQLRPRQPADWYTSYMFEKREISAFKKPLERLPLNSRTGLFRIGDNEDFIVREASFNETSIHFLKNLTLEERTKLLKDQLNELEEIYDIPVVPAQFVIAPVNTYKKAALFILAEKVIPLVENAQLIENIKTAKRELLEKLLLYLEKKSATGEIFMMDIFDLHQYVYGTTSDDPVPRYYLTDLDPLFSQSPGVLEEDSLTILKSQIETYDENQATIQDPSYAALLDRVSALSKRLKIQRSSSQE